MNLVVAELCCGTPCQLPAERWELAGKSQRQSSIKSSAIVKPCQRLKKVTYKYISQRFGNTLFFFNRGHLFFFINVYNMGCINNYVKGRYRYLLPPARLCKRAGVGSAKTQKSIQAQHFIRFFCPPLAAGVWGPAWPPGYRVWYGRWYGMVDACDGYLAAEASGSSFG